MNLEGFIAAVKADRAVKGFAACAQTEYDSRKAVYMNNPYINATIGFRPSADDLSAFETEPGEEGKQKS